MRGYDSTSNDKRIMREDVQEGTDLCFKEIAEPWNTYELADGSTLRIRAILQEVKRLKKHDRSGKPIYVFRMVNVTRMVHKK